MNRRTVLVITGSTLSVASAGCLRGGGGTGGENDPDEGERTENEDAETQSDEKVDPPRDLVLENNHDETHTMIVTLSKEDEIHSGEYELEPDTVKRVEELIAEAGDYTLEATLEDGTSETIEQNVYSEIWDAYATITENGELFISYDVA